MYSTAEGDFPQHKRRAIDKPARDASAQSMPNSIGSAQMPSSIGGVTGYSQYVQGGYASYPDGAAARGLPLPPLPSKEAVNPGAPAQGYFQPQSLYTGMVSQDEPFPPIDDSKSMTRWGGWEAGNVKPPTGAAARDQETEDESDREQEPRMQSNMYGLFDCPYADCERKGSNGCTRRRAVVEHRVHVHKEDRQRVKRGQVMGNSLPKSADHVWECTEPDCNKAYTTSGGLKIHLWKAHNVDSSTTYNRILECTQPNCKRPYSIKESLHRHLQADHGVETKKKRPSQVPASMVSTFPAFSSAVPPVPNLPSVSSYGPGTGYVMPSVDTYPRPSELRGRISQSGSRDSGPRRATQSSSRSNSQDSDIYVQSSDRGRRQAPSGPQSRGTGAFTDSNVRGRATAGDSGSFTHEVTSRMAQASLRQQPVRTVPRDTGSLSDGNAFGSQKKFQIDKSKKPGSASGPSKISRSFMS